MKKLLLGSVSLLMLGCSSVPKNVGVVDGKLHACPNTPNCVSSYSKGKVQGVQAFVHQGDASNAWALLKTLIKATPRTKIVVEEANYMRVEATSKVLRFVDDLEFLRDDANQLFHVRSASRVGRKDFGVNRERVETLHKQWKEKLDHE